MSIYGGDLSIDQKLLKGVRILRVNLRTRILNGNISQVFWLMMLMEYEKEILGEASFRVPHLNPLA